MPSILEGVTIRVTHNVREHETKILAYRKGGFNRPYRAIIPVCSHSSCIKRGKKSETEFVRLGVCKSRHQKFVDTLVQKLIKSYR